MHCPSHVFPNTRRRGLTGQESRHRKLNRETALGFAPGTHAFMDRLGAQLGGPPLPNWQERYRQVAGQYPPSWASRQS